MSVRIAVLVATYNRRVGTLNSLRALFNQQSVDDVDLKLFLVDASSPDRTLEAVGQEYPHASLRSVSSDFYWASSMRLASEDALSEAPFEYVLWLNDDVQLDSDALSRILKCSRDIGDGAVVVGATRSASGEVTYAGYDQVSRIRALQMRPVLPGVSGVDCDTFNGNFVLIPWAIDRALGGFPRGFTHALADHVYGFRVRKAGYRCVVAPGTVGVCERNSIDGSWQDRTLPAARRWKQLTGPKGLPPRQWIPFALRFGGFAGVVAAFKPYVSVGSLRLAESLQNRGRSRT